MSMRVSLLELSLFFSLNEVHLLLPHQCTVNMEGGKMVCKTGKFCHIQELVGGEMVEVSWTLP